LSQEQLNQLGQMLDSQLSTNRGGAELIAQALAADEQIIATDVGAIGKTDVVLCATDRRLIIAGKVFFFREFHEFPYSRINSLDIGGVSFGIVGMQDLRINAAGGGISVRVYSPRDAQDFIGKVNGQLARQSESHTRTESADDVAAALERLARVHREGAITDEEFAAKKAELLSRI
jgi:Short C-terminal domain/Bacterial PH domain